MYIAVCKTAGPARYVIETDTNERYLLERDKSSSGFKVYNEAGHELGHNSNKLLIVCAFKNYQKNIRVEERANQISLLLGPRVPANPATTNQNEQ